uniref:Uncharacterized protein LOC111100099 n=1 Tax=Crassostrea virginica TaxID=6565 RepID=A0A8B8AA80_CRAVI|nr:uncharacterized protein LOC111100099 [Crassostrea virginica]
MLKLVISFGIFTACFIEIFSVQRTEFFNFYPEMTNLVPGHLFVFEREQMSLVRCVTFCLLSQDCAAVFRKSASSVCQGFGNPFLFESRNEISNGTWHVKSVSDSCSIGGYIWNPIIRICYKYHSIRTSIFVAKSTCLSEKAHLLLLTSERIHNFAVNVMETQSSGSLYVQGSRDSISSSVYQDDHGRQMSNLAWSEGEPSMDGTYLRLNTEYHRLEATPGSTGRRFICQRGQL